MAGAPTIVSVCGSLGAGSANRDALDVAAGRLRTTGVVHDVPHVAIAAVPMFDPAAVDDPPPAVAELRAVLEAADGVLIAAPEYAGGLAGGIKNTLDWLVGSGSLYHRPVAVLSAYFDDATAQEILQTMATKMDDVLDGLGYDKAESLQGRTPYELVTIASLVERETGQPPEERGKIARVIMNRLDDGEPLGIDAANLYGLGRTSGELTKADLAVESPYNVRKNKGLPPTPICLPGEASLRAAIEAPAGTWRYYVLTTKDPPTHLFTDSYREFQKAKADAQARGVF